MIQIELLLLQSFFKVWKERKLEKKTWQYKSIHPYISFSVLHLALNSAPWIYLWECIIAETRLIYFHISYLGLKLFALIAKFKARGGSFLRLCLSEGEVNFPAGSSLAVENEEALGNFAANVLSNSWIDLLNNYPRMRRNPSVMAALCRLICIPPHLWINIGLAFSPMESADGRKKLFAEWCCSHPLAAGRVTQPVAVMAV